jgi:hypothetical protein
VGIVSLNNSRFIEYVDCICLPELQLRDATNAARSTSYIERNIFNKRDDFDFLAINFPLIRSNIQTAPVVVKLFNVPDWIDVMLLEYK